MEGKRRVRWGGGKEGGVRERRVESMVAVEEGV